MIPAPFEYARARSLEEAIELLADEEARPLAGGHSLLPVMRLRLSQPSLLVDIAGLGDLRYVREDGDRVAIGALARHADLERDPVLRASCPILAQTAAEIGDPQVRHRGTIGGSVAHGDPASDLPTVLLTLDADVVVHGPDGERVMPAAEFFTGPFETALRRQELVTELRVPKVADGVYVKFARRAQDWATVAVAAARVGGRVAVGLTSMGPTPLRARGVEEALAGGASPGDAAARAAEGASPSSDQAGSADYRRHLAQVLTKRALEQLGPG